MKVLISKNFKAVRTGIYVTASADAGEFIFDSDDCENLTAATLQEVAKANKIEVAKKADKVTLVTALVAGIEAMKIPVQNEKPDTLVVKEIVEQGTKDGLEDDDIVVKIIEAGIKYKAAARMFAQAKTDLGLMVSTKERKEQAKKIMLDEDFKPESYDDVKSMIDTLTDQISDTTTQQATKLIRSYCKEYEIEMPKPEKGVRGGFRTKVLDFMVRNPLADRKALDKFIKGEGKDQKVADRTWKTFEFAKKFAASHVKAASADTAEVAESEEAEVAEA